MQSNLSRLLQRILLFVLFCGTFTGCSTLPSEAKYKNIFMDLANRNSGGLIKLLNFSTTNVIGKQSWGMAFADALTSGIPFSSTTKVYDQCIIEYKCEIEFLSDCWWYQYPHVKRTYQIHKLFEARPVKAGESPNDLLTLAKHKGERFVYAGTKKEIRGEIFLSKNPENEGVRVWKAIDWSSLPPSIRQENMLEEALWQLESMDEKERSNGIRELVEILKVEPGFMETDMREEEVELKLEELGANNIEVLLNNEDKKVLKEWGMNIEKIKNKK